MNLLINDRMQLIISLVIPKKNRFKFLSEISNIPETTWRTWNLRSSSPSSQMIESIAKNYPCYAFWLITGIEDKKFGHVMPNILNNSNEVHEISKNYFDLEIKNISSNAKNLDLFLLKNNLKIVELEREKIIKNNLTELDLQTI